MLFDSLGLHSLVLIGTSIPTTAYGTYLLFSKYSFFKGPLRTISQKAGFGSFSILIWPAIRFSGGYFVVAIIVNLLVAFAIRCVVKIYCEKGGFSFAFSAKMRGYILTGYTGNVDVLAIPASHTGKPVVGIFHHALDNTKATHIEIPNGLISIGGSVFPKSLKTITIPAGVVSIGPRAFSFCTNLENITIPASVVSIGPSAFSFCTSLESITIPANVANIGANTFDGWIHAQRIYIPFATLEEADKTWAKDEWNLDYWRSDWRSGSEAVIMNNADPPVRVFP